MENEIAKLTQWYYDFDKLDANDQYLELGYILPFENPKFINFLLDKWVENYDRELDSLKEGTYEFALSISQRAFTFNEFSLVMKGKVKQEDFHLYRVFEYLHILDDNSLNFFIASHSKDDEKGLLESFLETIERVVKLEIPTLEDFFFKTKIKSLFPLSSMKRHLYILGQSGSGKSQLIKLMFYKLQEDSQKRRNQSLVLLEPHGDLATEVLQFSLNSGEGKERIVYLDPFLRDTAKKLLGEDILKEDYTFVLNPFNSKAKTNREINYLTQELSSAFFEILKSDTSEQMEVLIEACVDTLLRLGNSSIADLKRFMNDDENEYLIQQGGNNPNIERKKLIKKLKDSTSLKSTKSGIDIRLQSIIGDLEVRRLLVGESTVDLEKEVNSGKVIIFNLSKGILGKKASPALGKLFIALIQGAVRKRQEIEERFRKPTFMFIDEAQNYITPTIDEIMAESRKYGLHMVLANQVLGQDMDSKMKRIILGNTAVKIAGDNEEDSLKAMSKQMGGLKVQDFDKLPKYSFYAYDKTRKEVGFKTLRVQDTLVKVKPPFYVDKEELKELFLWLANDSGYYIKQSLADERQRNKATQKVQKRKLYDPKFED